MATIFSRRQRWNRRSPPDESQCRDRLTELKSIAWPAQRVTSPQKPMMSPTFTASKGIEDRSPVTSFASAPTPWPIARSVSGMPMVRSMMPHVLNVLNALRDLRV